MKGHWTVSVLVSILILGSLGLSQQAFANPISVTHSDLPGCDPLFVEPDVEELGTAFPTDELISTLDLGTFIFTACPTNDGPGSNVLVEITNLTPFDFIDVWYVAAPSTTLRNFDGTVDDGFGSLFAFKIDSPISDPFGLNLPLFGESFGPPNDIFESGETWTFIIDEYFSSLSLPPSAIIVPGLTSPGIESGSIIAIPDFGGGPVGGTSIPIDTTTLLVAGAQTTTPWLILAVISAVGIGLAVFTLRKH